MKTKVPSQNENKVPSPNKSTSASSKDNRTAEQMANDFQVIDNGAIKVNFAPIAQGQNLAMDDATANMLWDFEHGKTIARTSENIQRAQAAFDAASMNKETYDAHSMWYSADGAASVLRNYNRARALMDVFGLPTDGATSGLNDGSGALADLRRLMVHTKMA